MNSFECLVKYYSIKDLKVSFIFYKHLRYSGYECPMNMNMSYEYDFGKEHKN